MKEEGICPGRTVAARNAGEMIGGYTLNQKVFGSTHHNIRYEDMTVTDLEGQVDSRKLKKQLDNQELIQKIYQSLE